MGNQHNIEEPSHQDHHSHQRCVGIGCLDGDREARRPAELRTALSAFRNWWQEILAFVEFLPLHLSNGLVERKNNRTKVFMRQAYGFRYRRHLRLRILLEVA